jgi:periplasmic divalent cation tolerance protein
VNRTTDKVVALVTCGSAREANRIARALVERRVAACVNVLGTPAHSTYRWRGKVETAAEYLLLIKSSRKKFRALRAEVEHLHSYDVPEIIALPIVEGSQAYLRWLGEGLRPAAIRHRGTEVQSKKRPKS